MAANDLVSVFEKENGVKQIWEDDHRQTFQKVQNEYASPVHRQKQQPNNTNNNMRNSANQQISGSASIPSFSGFQSQRSICVSPSRQHTDRQGSFEENEEPNNNNKNDQQQQESPSLVHQQSTSPNRRNSPQITQIREQSTLQAIPSFSSISPSSTQLPLETKDSSPYKHRPTPLLIKMQSADQQRNITQNYSINKNTTGNQGVIKIQNTQNKGITEDQSPRKIISQQQQYQQKTSHDINNASSSQLDASPLKQASSKETSPMRSHRYFNYNNSKQRSNNNINTSQPRFQQQYQQSQNNISSSCTSQQVKTLITNTLTTTVTHSNLPIIQSSFQSQSNIDPLSKNASQPNLLSCVWGDDNDNDQILSKQKDVMLRKYINRESNSQADRMANTARLKLESLPYKPQSQQDNGIQKPTIRRDEGGEDASQLYYDLSPIKRDILTDLVRKTNKKFLGQQQIDKIEGNKPGIVISNGTTRERWNSQDSQNVNPCLQSSQQFILPIHPDIIKSMSNKRKHNMLRTAISEMGQDSAREKRIYNESTLPRTLEKMKESALRKKSSMILSGPMLVALTNNDSQEINHIIEENISRNKRTSMGANENADMLDVHVDKISKEDLEKYEKEGQIMQISSSSRQSSVNQPSRNENSNTQPYQGMLTERIPSKGPWVSNSPLKRNKTQYTHLKAYIPGDNSTANPATATKASILQMSLTTVSLTRKLQPTANKQQHQGTLEINEAQEKQQLTSQGFQNDASLRNKETFPQTQQLGDTGRIRGSNHIIGGGIQGRSIEGQGYGVPQKSSTQLMQHPIINSALFSNSARDTAQQFASTSQFQYSPMRNVKKF